MKLIAILCVIIFSSCAQKPITAVFYLEQPPLIGETAAKQKIYLGGLSSLQFLKKESNHYYFNSVTDRGPNAEVTDEKRPFLLPDFSPLLVQLRLDTSTGHIDVLKTQNLKLKNGKPILGYKNIFTQHEQSAKNEQPVTIFNKKIKNKSNGIDSEGFCKWKDFYFLSEEYGPELIKVNKNLRLVKRYSPGEGFSADLALRKPNRGFEGLACSNEYLYLMLQSPVPTKLAPDKDKIRLIKFNPQTGKSEKQYYYPVSKDGADKIGDLTLINELASELATELKGSERFLVIEQNGKLGKQQGVRRIVKIDLNKADSHGVLTKETLLDLNKAGLENIEKIEGITIIDSKTLALVADNDFSLAGPINFKTGVVDFDNEKKSAIILISFSDKIF